MTLKNALLVSIIGVGLHVLLKLLGMTAAMNGVALLDLLLFEGSILFFLVVFYMKQ